MFRSFFSSSVNSSLCSGKRHCVVFIFKLHVFGEMFVMFLEASFQICIFNTFHPSCICLANVLLCSGERRSKLVFVGFICHMSGVHFPYVRGG